MTGLLQENSPQIGLSNDEDRLYLAPALTWKPQSGTSITCDNAAPTPIIPAQGSVLPNPNGRIPTSFLESEPFYDRFHWEGFSTTYLIEHKLDATWTLRHSLRYAEQDTKIDQIYAFGFAPGDLRVLPRYVFDASESSEGLATDTSAEAKFRIGPMQHTLVAGVDYRWSSIDETRLEGPAADLDAFAPVYGQPYGPADVYYDQAQTIDQLGGYFQHQIKFYDTVVLSGGVRYDKTGNFSDDRLNQSLASQDSCAKTYNAGIVYLLGGGLAPYASYSESFEPLLGTNRQGELFDPTTAQQKEVGIKYQPTGTSLLATLAFFDIVRQNTLTTDPVDPFFLVQTGETQSRGFEVEMKAGLFDKALNLTGGYSYTDIRYTQDNDGYLGLRPGAVLAHLASFWADYTFQDGLLKGFGFGGGVRYVGSSLDESNTFEVPAYTLYDAMLSYDFGGSLQGTTLSVNAANLLDESFVASCDTIEGCYYGRRRSILATLKYRW